MSCLVCLLTAKDRTFMETTCSNWSVMSHHHTNPDSLFVYLLTIRADHLVDSKSVAPKRRKEGGRTIRLHNLCGRPVFRFGPNGIVRGRPLFFGSISDEWKRMACIVAKMNDDSTRAAKGVQMHGSHQMHLLSHNHPRPTLFVHCACGIQSHKMQTMRQE